MVDDAYLRFLIFSLLLYMFEISVMNTFTHTHKKIKQRRGRNRWVVIGGGCRIDLIEKVFE